MKNHLACAQKRILARLTERRGPQLVKEIVLNADMRREDRFEALHRWCLVKRREAEESQNMTVEVIRQGRRAFIADTTALVVFFTTTGVINERLVAGMAWEQVLHARLLGAVLMIPVGRPYGMWRDFVMDYARPQRISQVLWDSLALVSFQVPLYAAIIAVSGANGRGLLLGILGATVLMLALGRPYGAFLAWVRALFGVTCTDGVRPMSLNT